MIGKNFKKIMYQLLSIFCMINKKKIYPTYVSKHNSNREKQAILLMIPNGEGRQYLSLKNYQHYQEE